MRMQVVPGHPRGAVQGHCSREEGDTEEAAQPPGERASRGDSHGWPRSCGDGCNRLLVRSHPACW